MGGGKLKEFFRNISYSFTANFISMFLGMLTVLIFPKLIGVETFGYYQLYIFYGTYVTITALGWADGAYLKIGGQTYEGLDFREQNNQFWMLTISQSIIYAGLLFWATYEADPDKRIVIILTCISALTIHPKNYLQLILQATDRIREYAVILITERVISIIICIVIILAGCHSYVVLIIIDILGRAISLIAALIYCKEFVFLMPKITFNDIQKVWSNISTGFMLLVALLSSFIIVGVVRYGVEDQWSIATFSKISLTISISNMVLRCINSIAVVMFPTFRRLDSRKLAGLYCRMNTGLMVLIFFSLIFYYPGLKLLGLWLPQYADSFRYAAILLPISAFECKYSMLISTYLKTIRQERILLWMNVVPIAISVVFTAITVYWLNNLVFAVGSILIVLILRCVISEICLGRILFMPVRKDIILEMSLTLIFIVCNWNWGLIGMLLYALCYLVYLAIKKNDCKQVMQSITSCRS